MVQDDGSKPWIWARRGESTSRPSEESQVLAVTEAAVLLQEVTEKVEAIKNDDSIPVRANKKAGKKSKKEVREVVQLEATESLKGIALKHGATVGKWLMFVGKDKVDFIWSKIAASLVSGPLSTTAAFLAKVATSPATESENYQHLICIYLPNVYDKDTVTEVMKVLLKSHGTRLSGVKPDLYTLIGLDSKHLSGISSTIWKGTGGGLMSESEIKALRDSYFEGIKTAEGSAATTADGNENARAKKPILAKAKPVADSDDPFASDDEAPPAPAPAPAKAASASAKLGAKARAVPKPSAAQSKKRQVESEDSSDEGGDSNPKRARK